MNYFPDFLSLDKFFLALYQSINKIKSVVKYNNYRFLEILYLDLKINGDFRKGYYQPVEDLSFKLVEKDFFWGWYYLARLEYTRANYQLAYEHITQLDKKSNMYTDILYLKAEILFMLGQKKLGWDILENVALRCKRLKTWLLMANATDNQEDFRRLIKNYHIAISNHLIQESNLVVREYIALGALRAHEYEDAIKIWRDTFLNPKKYPNEIYNKNVKKKLLKNQDAAVALSDLKKVLEKNNIEMFLISGTLLGCIRENKILAHDKDMDVGIWDTVDSDFLKKILQSFGRFYIQASRSPDLIRVKHINNIPIDIFIHSIREGKCWHGGVKMKWYNTPFSLKKYQFLGENYLIPNDYNLYLTENYGDWSLPKIDFDSAYDTPNSIIVNQYEYIAYTYKKAVFCRDSSQQQKYINILKQYDQLL